MSYNDRNREQDGRYAREVACDACGRPAREDYCTDEEVCGQTDDPGFFLCTRKRCVALVPEGGPEERRGYYNTQRAENKRADLGGRKPEWIGKAKRPRLSDFFPHA